MKRWWALAILGVVSGCNEFDVCDSDFGWGSHHHRRHSDPVCSPEPCSWLGVSTQNLNCDLSRRFGYPNERAVFIDHALPGGPSAGILRGADILIDIDGRPTCDMMQMERVLAGLAPGHVAALNIFREGRCQTVSVALGAMPVEYRGKPWKRTYYTSPSCD